MNWSFSAGNPRGYRLISVSGNKEEEEEELFQHRFSPTWLCDGMTPERDRHQVSPEYQPFLHSHTPLFPCLKRSVWLHFFVAVADRK